MFGGSNPSLKDLYNMGILGVILPQFSYARWLQEALFLNEIKTLPNTDRIQAMLERLQYSVNNWALDLIMLVAIGLAARLITYTILVFLGKTKQK